MTAHGISLSSTKNFKSSFFAVKTSRRRDIFETEVKHPFDITNHLVLLAIEAAATKIQSDEHARAQLKQHNKCTVERKIFNCI
jgi:hypothetical protein